MDQVSDAPLRRVAITGGNIRLYPDWSRLKAYFENNDLHPTLGIHYLNCDSKFIQEAQKFNIDLFVSFPINEPVWVETLRMAGENMRFVFMVTSEEEYDACANIIENQNITNCDVRPVFTGANLDFFIKEVFLNEEEILGDVVSQRMIFAHQKLNTNFFGNIWLLPNGDVKANPNGRVLGNIAKEPVASLLEKELSGTDFWRNIRNGQPCSDCLLQYLCPSPSNYELVIGRNNLCNVKL